MKGVALHIFVSYSTTIILGGGYLLKTLNFDNNIYDTIRKNIKKYRKQKGLTSAQLSELVDLSHEFIRQIESEKIAYNFSVDTFYKISVALDVKLDELIQK